MDKHALPIPPAVQAHGEGMEIARVWASRGSQHVTLDVGHWDDPMAWGIMLVDLAKHIANAYHDKSGRSRDDVLARLRAGFDAEWSHATDEPTGQRVDL